MSIKNHIYKLSNQQISTSLSGESVILNHQKGEYFGLNEVGTLVWEKLKNSPLSFKNIVESVMENFDTTEDECFDDLEELMADLVNEKLVEIVA